MRNIRKWSGGTFFGMLLMLLCALATHSVMASNLHLDEGVLEALAARGEVRVLVLPEAWPDGGPRAVTVREQVDALLAEVPGLGARVERRFESFPGFAARVDASILQALRERGGAIRVGLDEGGSGDLIQSVPLAGVTPVHLAGLTGAGRKVVILDSGLRLDHQSFAGRIVAEACFCTNCCPNGQSTQFGAGAAIDGHGHGTNVAGIAAGAAGVAGVPRGVASSADIVAVRVLDNNNSFCCTSDIVAALEWVRLNHPDATVINASLGTNARYAGNCDNAASFTIAFASVLDPLRAGGILTSVSSGNNGSSTEMQVPACVSSALAVAAVYDANVGSHTFGSVCTDATTAADQMACFSNLSTTTDLLAPGARVTAAGRGSSSSTSTFSGTSMAAPMVAGCIALLKEAMPTATPAAIETALEASPVRISRTALSQEYPRLDCADALQRLLDLERIFINGFESG